MSRFMCPRCKRAEHHNCNDKGCECNCRNGKLPPQIRDDVGRLSDPKNDPEFKKIMDEAKKYQEDEEAKHKVVKKPG